MKLIIRAAAAALLLIAAACGIDEPTATVTPAPADTAAPAESPPAAPSTAAPAGPTTAAVGDTVSVDVTTGSGTIVLEAAGDLPPVEVSRPLNGRFLQVVVVATGVSGEFSINPFDFTVRRGDGTAYTPGFYVGEAAEQPLQHSQLAPGAKARGGIVFDVTVEPVTLEYAPALGITGVVAAWPL